MTAEAGVLQDPKENMDRGGDGKKEDGYVDERVAYNHRVWWDDICDLWDDRGG